MLFLIPATVIIAQNATQSMNSTGVLVLEQINITADTFADANQTNIEIPNASAIAEANVTLETIVAENQTIYETQNQTNMSEQNITIQENLSEKNAASNETVLNETIPVIANETENITVPESQANITIPEVMQPILDVRISSPDKTIRGEQFDISAVVSNAGNSDARNVRLTWEIPPGFEIVSGGDDSGCGTISPGSECVRNLTVSSSPSTGIGKNEIKVLVKYEE